MSRPLACILVILLATSYVCDAYKVLVIFPFPGKSHGILGKGIVNHLVKAGHEVTYITPFVKPSDNEPPNLRYIDLSSLLDQIPSSHMNLKSIIDGGVSLLSHSLFLLGMNYWANTVMTQENLVKLIDDPNEKFDLVIAEWMFTEVYSGLGTIFDAPFIWLSTLDTNWMILERIDEYTNPSYNPYNVPATAPLSFSERFYELFFTLRIALLRETIVSALQYRSYNNYVVPYVEKRGRVAPSWSEVLYNTSLVFGNSHVSMGHAARLPQNYIPIGGYHIDEEIKPLPEDLQKLMDGAKNGVIYFSMGSNLLSKDLPDELKKDLLQMFGALNQTVLWKFEDVMADLPENVHILQWAPQLSILSHPNCLVFITHGGQLSTSETVHTGVPIIGIPVFGDQYNNVERAERRGYAIQVTLSYTMAGDLRKAIEEIITDPKYRQKVKELSFIYHDRPVPPGAELVHWAEHVIKTRGAPHLRSPALLVPWYQKLYLDLILILVVAFCLIKRAYKYVKPLVFKKKHDQKKIELLIIIIKNIVKKVFFFAKSITF